MANNYISGAFTLEFISQEARDMFLALGEAIDQASYEPAALTEEQRALLTSAGLDENLDDLYQLAEDVDTYGTNSVYVSSGESINLEMVATCAQAVLKKFGGPPVGFEWAETCSKGRIGEFGGGACVVTADVMHWMTSGGWVDEKIKSLTASTTAWT